MKSASGTFVLRLPPDLHGRLREVAAHRGKSLNALCRDILQDAVGSGAERTAPPTRGKVGSSPLDRLTQACRRTFGPDLAGLALFGSVARGEEFPDSDLDLLLVMVDSRPIRRELYTRWEKDVAAIAEAHFTREVTPHFVALAGPAGGGRRIVAGGRTRRDGALGARPRAVGRAARDSRLLGERRGDPADEAWASLLGAGRGWRPMKNVSLIADHITRAEHRLAAVRLLAERESWADVVRESQEVVELCLKALLRSARVEVPRIHDVSKILRAETARLPKAIRPHVGRLADISHSMRRDRELAFYGSEDLTPSEFYEEKDGKAALDQATWVFRTVRPVLTQR